MKGKYLIHLSITIQVEADDILDVEIPSYLDYIVKECDKRYDADGGIEIAESDG